MSYLYIQLINNELSVIPEHLEITQIRHNHNYLDTINQYYSVVKYYYIYK